jgi:hypothetical protein
LPVCEFRSVLSISALTKSWSTLFFNLTLLRKGYICILYNETSPQWKIEILFTGVILLLTNKKVMKKIISLAMLLIVSACLFSQQATPSQPLTHEDYLKKSKNQKTAGWILLGSGALLTTIGVVVGMNEAEDIVVDIFDPYASPSNDDATLATVLTIGGVLAMAGSIPLFIASGKNKKKSAASVSFKMEKTNVVGVRDISIKQYPAVAFQIRL